MAAASSLEERRLSGDFLPLPDRGARVPPRLDEWRRLVVRREGTRFEDRFAVERLDLDGIQRVLGTVQFSEDQPLPIWAKTVLEFMLWGPKITELETLKNEICTAAAPIPFEDLLLPALAFVRQTLWDEDYGFPQLPQPCRIALARDLLQQLSYIAAQTFGNEFATFRKHFNKSPGNPSDGSYRAFVHMHLENQFREIFSSYPVLARLLAVRTNSWVEATREFVTRLQADLPILQANFSIQHLTDLHPGLSDPHHGGRQVIGLTFDGQTKLVYKPRDLSLEASFNNLLTWLNERGVSPPLKTLTILNFGTHGWMEFVPHAPCHSLDEARNYYHRAGMLAALVYALRGRDYHSENLIACGAHPVLIDHEMLLQPDTFGAPKTSAQGLAQRWGEASILGTGLINAWVTGEKGVSHDMSALGGVGTRVVRHRVWKNPNTNAMKHTWETFHFEPEGRENVPILDGKPLSPEQFLTEFKHGFRQMYRLLAFHRQEFLASDGLFEAFKTQQNRFVFRKTSLYWDLLYVSLHPKHLQAGIDRSIQLDRLSRAFLKNAELQPFWALFKAEITALEKTDIPHFSTRVADGTLILEKNHHLKNAFPTSAFQTTRAHIEQLDETDLARQLELIDLAFTLPTPPAHTQPPTTPDFHELAHQIAQKLETYSFQTDEEAAWLEWDPLEHRLSPVEFDLYGGQMGIAYFLAAMSRVEPAAPWRTLAQKALQPVLNLINDPQSKLHPPQTSLGIGDGLGGLLYGLTQISYFLDDPTLLESARRVATLITPERIAKDQKLDVISGAAGAILGLLACNTACPAETLYLERALACGEHLLNTFPRTQNAFVGFAHGATGIAYSLSRLFKISGEKSFHDAAEAIFAAETHYLKPDKMGWKNLPQALAENPDLMGSWCRGASGLGLSRIGNLPNLGHEELRGIEASLQTLEQSPAPGNDFLCCGTLGQVEFLLNAARGHLSSPARETAHRLATLVARRAAPGWSADPNADYPQKSGEMSGYRPGLFKGLSGAGYIFLRLAYPDFPSILLFT